MTPTRIDFTLHLLGWSNASPCWSISRNRAADRSRLTGKSSRSQGGARRTAVVSTLDHAAHAVRERDGRTPPPGLKRETWVQTDPQDFSRSHLCVRGRLAVSCSRRDFSKHFHIGDFAPPP